MMSIEEVKSDKVTRYYNLSKKKEELGINHKTLIFVDIDLSYIH